ncbi:hypothetical protein GPZ74_33670 [Burkholderia pseudomallei]|nr:hypothetical protein [Burkholderia pseudomallei]
MPLLPAVPRSPVERPPPASRRIRPRAFPPPPAPPSPSPPARPLPLAVPAPIALTIRVGLG